MLAENFSGTLEQIFTGFGQDHPTRRACEQLQSDLVFELPDLHRYRRLRDIYRPCTGRKRLRLGDRKKRLELSDFHVLNAEVGTRIRFRPPRSLLRSL